MQTRFIYSIMALSLSTACNAQTPSSNQAEAGNIAANSAVAADDGSFTPSASKPFVTEAITSFDTPWAMTFIGNGPLALVTERKGTLILLDTSNGAKRTVSGVPAVDFGGQGGLGDIITAPGGSGADGRHAVYLSWAEAGPNDTRGAAVARADLVISDQAARLENLSIIWRQSEKVTGNGHFAHRLAFSPDGQYLFISSGDRQKFEPAQDMKSNLGKIIRIKPDGGIPADNPFAAQGGVTAQIWSLGQRNPLSIAFDRDGRLWESEMGPKGGDEINLIVPKGNYGYPRVSNGDHYDGKPITDHAPGDGFLAPKAYWTPSISPGGMAYYNGALFPQWRHSLLLAALSGKALIRLQIEGDSVRKADHWDMGARIREVESAPDGSVWVLEDGEKARLLKLTPRVRTH